MDRLEVSDYLKELSSMWDWLQEQRWKRLYNLYLVIMAGQNLKNSFMHDKKRE
jgi:hypothetical protein